MAWQFPLREAELNLSPKKVIAHWDTAHDGRGIAELKAHLVRKIRQWRPDVIIVPDPRSESTPAASRIIAQMTDEAAQAAGDSTVFTGQLVGAGLRPWRVRKVFCMAPPGAAGDVGVTSSQLAVRLGTSLAGYCDVARGLLDDQPAAAPNLIEFRLLGHDVSPQAARRDIFSGLALHPGGEARRRLGDPLAGDIARCKNWRSDGATSSRF